MIAHSVGATFPGIRLKIVGAVHLDAVIVATRAVVGVVVFESTVLFTQNEN